MDETMVGSDKGNSHGGDGHGDGDAHREEIVEEVRDNNHVDESAKEVKLREGNVADKLQQEGESFQDVVHTDDAVTEFLNVTSKSFSSTSSSSGSSLSDGEVVVEKEKPADAEIGEIELQDESSASLSAVVVTPDHCVEETIESLLGVSVKESTPTQESDNKVFSLLQVSSDVSESEPIDDWSTSEVIVSGLKQNLDGVLQPSNEKTEVASGVTDSLQQKNEENFMADTSESESVAVTTTKSDEGLLPQCCVAKGIEGCYMDDDGKVLETQKYTEDQPLLSSAPMPLRPTSWMNCCGIFEIFAGGSH